MRHITHQKLDPEESLVWYLTDKRYRELHRPLISKIDWRRFKWDRALKYALKNRVLYKLSQEALSLRDYIDGIDDQKLKPIMVRRKRDLERFRVTLKVIKDLWDGKINYYVIKTREDSPTQDVDVLFLNAEDYESAINIALTKGYRFVREEPFKGWINVDGGIKIEMHCGISWFGMQAFDEDFIASNTRTAKLMNYMFQLVSEYTEFALDLAHWIIDVQPITIDGFSRLVAKIEENPSLTQIFDQAKKYRWHQQLVFHLSCLNKLCEYIYMCRIDLPIKLLDLRIRPRFPFFIPFYIKVPFLMEKILHDNIKFSLRAKMLQLGLRRYAWTRLMEML